MVWQIGQNMTTRHFRGDKELQPLATQTYYDFNFQVNSQRTQGQQSTTRYGTAGRSVAHRVGPGLSARAHMSSQPVEVHLFANRIYCR